MSNRQTDKYSHCRTSVYNLNYHLIWGTKYRNKWLTPSISDEIKHILKQIACEEGFTISHIEIGLDDHIHLLISAPPSISVSEIVRKLKGKSAYIIFRAHPELKKYYWKSDNRHLWSQSYFVESIGTTNENAVAKYIDEQRVHETHG